MDKWPGISYQRMNNLNVNSKLVSNSYFYINEYEK